MNIAAVSPEDLTPLSVIELLEKKDNALRNVAHDLRNPIAGIASTADLLLDMEEVREEPRELVHLIKEAAAHSLLLIGELLVAESDHARYAGEATDVNRIITNCAQLLKRQINNKLLTLTLNLTSQRPMVGMPPDKLTRIIDNLVGNAIKFTPAGGNIQISTRIMNGGFYLIVRDNGLGIKEELLPGLFDGAGKNGQTGTQGERSFGLGLPICKQIVEAYGGTIAVQSRLDKGAVFYVWLPI